MKRIIISDDNLPSKLPQILHLKKSQHPNLTIQSLLSLLHHHFPSLSTTLIGVRTFTQDHNLDFKLSSPSFPISSLPLPIQLVMIITQPLYQISSSTPLSISLFQPLKQIGSGTFSTVYVCHHKYNYQLYTLKLINKQSLLLNGQLSQLKNQIQILKYLRNIMWICQLYYCFEDSENVYLIMEYCPNGDLFKQIRKCKRFSEDEGRVVFIQALWCLYILRQKGVIHRDIKPQNFIIDNKGYLKLTDFGFAQKLLPHQTTKGLCGSYQYMAPQMIQRKEYSYSYDIYALGVLLYEILIGKTPFEGIRKENVKEMMKIDVKYPEYVGEQARDLIGRLMRRVPEERLGGKDIKDIFEHSWLKNQVGLINNILSRKQQSIFYQINVLKDIKFFPVSSHYSQHSSTHWGIQYNYLTPTFTLSPTKLGPKLSPQTNPQL